MLFDTPHKTKRSDFVEAKKKTTLLFRFLRIWVKLFSPKMENVGRENLPEEPCIVVANHCQMYGPISCELYPPRDGYTWCAGQMMVLKDVPAYAFQDFWSQKPKSVRWLFKIFSYLIAPVSVCVFNNARTIGVWRDTRIISTFKQTVKCLKSGLDVVIFPECPEKHNQIVNKFQENFIDVAKLYYKQTGKAVSFVPMYIAPMLKTQYLGKPISFDPEAPMEEERKRITDYAMAEITRLGESLPEHIVVPYNNIPRNQYPRNI